MISVKLTIDKRPLELIRNHAPKVPTLMRTAYKRQSQSLRRRVLARVRTEPGSPHYPLRWKSEKQRRYVMAKLRAEGNLPYQRTHDYVNAFEVNVIDTADGGILAITNDYYAAQFIGGEHQQPFHSDTNWLRVDDVVVEFRPIAERELQEIFYTVTDPFAGVTR